MSQTIQRATKRRGDVGHFATEEPTIHFCHSPDELSGELYKQCKSDVN